MLNRLSFIGDRFARRSLRTQIVTLVMGAFALAVGLMGYLSLVARIQLTEKEAIEMARALADMTAKATVSSMLERDYASMELFLSGAMTLPGVRSAELVYPGGQVAIKVSRAPSGHTTHLPPAETRQTPTDWHRVTDMQVMAISPLLPDLTASDKPPKGDELLANGWVQIELTQLERRNAALQQWLGNGLKTLFILTFMLWLFALFLRRVFGPITALADLAKQLAGQPGATLKMRWGSLEVRELGQALNVTSEQLAQQINTLIEVKQRLVERTARLDATFDLSPDGFAIFDAAGELVSSNPALSTMIGEVKNGTPLARFQQDLQQLCEVPESCCPMGQEDGQGSRQTLVLSRPSPKVLEREVRRRIGDSGETFIYFRDVTQRYEVDRIKSEFLATAAHELRTPLASILGFTELMLHRQFSEEKRKDLLETVHRQGTLLSSLIHELLDLSRIEARQGKDFHIVATPLADIVQIAVSGFHHAGLGRGVNVRMEPDLNVMADFGKIQQALNNLLSNALKYSPGGGDIQLTVREAEREGHAFAVLEVVDHGIGMTPEQLARVFERFYRADNSGNIPGTGLGLNLVKEIADVHGGSVELSSEPGVGTTASLWLRQAEKTSDAAALV